jgi:hypothetical protein
LLVDCDEDASRTAIQGIRSRRLGVDQKLLLDLYAASPSTLRVRLVGSPAFRYLEPRFFEPRFLETYRRKHLTRYERRDLALVLESFLRRHPPRAKSFSPLILSLLRSRQWEYRLRGLKMIDCLNEIGESDQELILRALQDRSPEIRMQACNGLRGLARRRSGLSPALRQFCMSSKVRLLAEALYERDPNVDVQTCAYYFLRAREPRVRRLPPRGMPVPPPKRGKRWTELRPPA